MIEILVDYREAFLKGALTTLHLTLWVWCIGLFVGVQLGVLRSRVSGPVAGNALTFVFLAFGSVPVLVYLFWFHFPVQQILGVVWDPFITSSIVLGLFNAIMISDVVRGALADFPRELEDVAKVTGVSKSTFIREVKFPIILASVLPGYVATQVTALHSTLFASLISVEELFRQAQRINSIEYDPVSTYSLLVIFYFVLSFPLLIGAKVLEHRFEKFRREI